MRVCDLISLRAPTTFAFSCPERKFGGLRRLGRLQSPNYKADYLWMLGSPTQPVVKPPLKKKNFLDFRSYMSPFFYTVVILFCFYLYFICF